MLQIKIDKRIVVVTVIIVVGINRLTIPYYTHSIVIVNEKPNENPQSLVDSRENYCIMLLC